MTESIVHNERRHRFEILVDDEMAGYTHYRLSNGVATFDHTETAEKFAGQGMAGRLVTAAFDEIRAEGQWRIRAVCPFVMAFVQRNRSYDDLLVR